MGRFWLPSCTLHIKSLITIKNISTNDKLYIIAGVARSIRGDPNISACAFLLNVLRPVCPSSAPVGYVRGKQVTDVMAFTLYSLIQAAILCVNAVAVLHEERFLCKSKYIKNKKSYAIPGEL